MFQRCEEDNEAPSHPPQENYLLTLQALESRLQVSIYHPLKYVIWLGNNSILGKAGK